MVRRRRLLLVTKLGSFMKTSWRRSREILTADDNDCDEGKKQQNGNSCQTKQRRSAPLSVRFDDEVSFFPSRAESNDDENDNESADDENDERWYGKDDYLRFKKDTILSTLNYIATKRRNKSRFFDDDAFEAKGYSVRGIENSCEMDDNLAKRRETDKKCLHKALREEQARQKRTGSYLDVDKLRSVSLLYTKGERARALARGSEDARSVRTAAAAATAAPPSPVKNLFAGTKLNNKHFRRNNNNDHNARE